MKSKITAMAAFFGMLTIILGAFGAHALKEKLDALIANTEKQAPAQALEVMHRATAALKNSDIMWFMIKN